MNCGLVVEPVMYFYKKFWLAGSTTHNVKILRKYIAGFTTLNVFEKNFTLWVVKPAMCFKNVFLFFVVPVESGWRLMEDTMVKFLWCSSFSLVQRRTLEKILKVQEPAYGGMEVQGRWRLK